MGTMDDVWREDVRAVHKLLIYNMEFAKLRHKINNPNETQL